MKEIKFRAWHKKYKKMYSVSDLHMATIMNGGIWATVNGRNPIEDKDIKIQIQPKDIIVQQYTGWKDRSGKEIYIGDVVMLGNHEQPYEVMINDFMQIPVIDNELGQEDLYKVYHSCRVIGNIYDMPDWNF